MNKLQKLIKTAKFDWTNSDITIENFPEPKEISKDYKVYNFDKIIEADEVIKEIGKDGYCAANIYELLEYAKKDWNGKDYIVALGSVGSVDGDRNVACLYGGGSGRYLRLDGLEDSWVELWRFLAVRKVSELGNLEPKPSRELEPLELEFSVKINGVEYKLVKK